MDFNFKGSTSTTTEPPVLASSPSSSLGSSAQHPSPLKRPAGRTKFQETRHPLFRRVRQRGRARRWVCEVCVPGSRGDHLWVGTFDTAKAATRAHDATMLALCGDAACHNFADSSWLLHVPCPATAAGLPDVQHPATKAVAGFMQRQRGGDAPTAAASSQANAATVAASAVPPAMDSGGSSLLDLDVFGGMDDAGSYYASLAQGLLIDPPLPVVDCPEEDEDCDAGEMELWG